MSKFLVSYVNKLKTFLHFFLPELIVISVKFNQNKKFIKVENLLIFNVNF